VDKDNIVSDIISVIEECESDDGWVDLASLGGGLKKRGINYKTLGFAKLKELLEKYPDNIEIKKNDCYQVPVFYAKIISHQIPDPHSKVASLVVKEKISSAATGDLMKWAWLGDSNRIVSALSEKALDEIWCYEGRDDSSRHPHPILWRYLKNTFFRLVKENKVIIEDEYASFNTGLVDDLYEPIYALFDKNKNPGRQKWHLLGFCTPGVGRQGKLLSSNFNPLPERARFYDSISELIYDTSLNKPQLDWAHIILDNVARLPEEFLEENKPEGFMLKNPSSMDDGEKDEYFKSLSNAIESDSKKFRIIKNRFSDSLVLALKKVQWNFKTAIPMYYPRNNKISLLLPLSLIDDDKIDLALVVEKTKSNSYLGHTILPLSSAYSNARLIARPDSDWLIVDKIEASFSVDDKITEDILSVGV